MKSIRPLRNVMPDLRIPAVVFLAIALAAALMAQSFDYYVLSLSWAPAFCAQPNAAARNPLECATGRHIGFIVHGLWPEAAGGRGPENCGPAKPVAKAIVNYALPVMLSPGLIQHEWATHGVCTGLKPFDYFSSLVEARAAVQIPVQIISIDKETTEGPHQIENEFADANPSFPRAAFRTFCTGRTFQEERVCFDKNLKPRACTAAVADCTSPAIVIRPPL